MAIQYFGIQGPWHYQHHTVLLWNSLWAFIPAWSERVLACFAGVLLCCTAVPLFILLTLSRACWVPWTGRYWTTPLQPAPSLYNLLVFIHLKKAVKGHRFGVTEDFMTVVHGGSAGAQEVLYGGNSLASVSMRCLPQCPWLLFLTLCLCPELCPNRFHLNNIS